jgi:hypothetical protein
LDTHSDHRERPHACGHADEHTRERLARLRRAHVRCRLASGIKSHSRASFNEENFWARASVETFSNNSELATLHKQRYINVSGWNILDRI